MRDYVHPDFGTAAVSELAEALNGLLADYVALFVKAKAFHWHVPGPSFREHHAMLDEHASAALAVVDTLAERVRKLGGTTILSVGEVTRRQRIVDCDTAGLSAPQMFAALREDNQQLLSYLREAHGVCEEYGDSATSGHLELWIDQAEERLWHLHEACRLAAD
jgi:starvation-inducible DNA-binding protein